MRLLKYSIAILLFSFPFTMSALHIIGGVLTYKYLGPGLKANTNNYEFTLKLYRDCYAGGADFDVRAAISIYEGTKKTTYSTDNVPLRSQSSIKPPSNPCLIVPPNVCVEEGIYVFTKELPISTQSYTISYQRCCRNNSINNLINPGQQGITVSIELTPESQTFKNNSPVFESFPPIALCVNEPIQFDHKATDTEGDQIVYEFCAPFQGGGQGGGGGGGNCNNVMPNPACPPPYLEVEYNTPSFNALIPMGGKPPIQIDPNTGLITGTPTLQGQYVVGVCAKEYRNGKLLSLVRRDFQFNVLVCQQLVTAKVKGMEGLFSKFTLKSCGKDTLTILNQTAVSQFVKNYKWEFDLKTKIFSDTTRDITVAFPGPGLYFGKMIVNPDPKGCSDTAYIEANIFPNLTANFSTYYDTCIAGSVNFEDKSVVNGFKVKKWDWEVGDGTKDSISTFIHKYSAPGVYDIALRVEDQNGCKDSTFRSLIWKPVPPVLIVQPSRYVGCPPIDIEFKSLSNPVDSSYKIKWNFGDGKTSNSISPTHQYDSVGVYTVKLEVTSPIGCYTSKEFKNLIKIASNPIAKFDYTPTTISRLDPIVQFTDLSKVDIRSWHWTFDDVDPRPLLQKNPLYTFQDTGLHTITLYVTDKNECKDSVTKIVDILPEVTFFIPNAFTPNGDGENEIFIPKGVIDGIKNYEMSIWDRWGGKIFSTDNPAIGWNGRFKNEGGDLLPDGVYQYIFHFEEPRGKVREYKGYVTLIR